MRKLTHKEVEQRILKKHQGRVLLTSKYTGANDPADLQCATCSYKWSTTTASILTGCGCPRCGGSLKGDNETAKKKIQKAHGDRVTLLGNYLGNKAKTELKCNVCNYTWKATPDHVFRGQGCPKCAHNTHNIIYFYKLFKGTYKIGVTTETQKHRRITEVCSVHGVTKPEILVFEKCKNAKVLEAIFKDCYMEYSSKQITNGAGYTEMYDLTKEQASELVSALKILIEE